jgi:DNA-binding SARP family transcriptional activator
MAATLHVRSLGGFWFRTGGEWVAGPAFKRGREFLEYFCAYPRATASRDSLAETFWPSVDAESALHRLHIAACGARSVLRKMFPGIDAIRCTGGAYTWHPDVTLTSDVERFLAYYREGSLEAMSAAIGMYAGEFLAGDDAEWMYPLRVRCSSLYATMLERLAADAMSRGDHIAALDLGLRLVESDRAHEGATRLTMQALAALGRRGAALAEFDELARYLKAHLGIDPAADTLRVRATILAGEPV